MKRKTLSALLLGVAVSAMIFSGTQVQAADAADAVAEAAEALELPYTEVYGNITLPTVVGDGVHVTWTTSHPDIVDVEAHENEGYDATPAGVVTRPKTDTEVTMTATLEKDGETDTKEFTFTVMEAIDELTGEDFTGYFFAYFAGEGYSNGEQVYFAASKDGLYWSDLNENEPVLTSTLGEKGVRDPFIIRSPEGDKFYMIATDLKIYNGKGWGAAQNAGSQSLMVWESTDLVNWSEQRMVEVSADIQAGCTWAPEAAYDPITGEYIVFWASKVKADNYNKQRLYYAKTRDFYTFTEPKVFIEDNQSSIDTTIIYNEKDGYYYRYTKNEGGATNEHGAKTKTVFAERCQTLLGEWESIASPSLNANQWVEGPTIFKFNSKDSAEDKWCLLVDDFGGIGYYPLVATDLSTGEFTKPENGTYRMPSRARHGTPVPVTQEEYEAVMAEWSTDAPVNDEDPQEAPVLEYDFEEKEGTMILDVTDNGNDGQLNGNATIREDAEWGSGVLYLDGSNNTFAAFPQGFFDGRNTFTITMDMKAEVVSGNFFAFTFGKNSTKHFFMKPTADSVKAIITTTSWNNEKGFTVSTGKANQNQWLHLTLIMDGMSMKLYLDDTLIGSNDMTGIEVSNLGRHLMAYLGKSFYSNDNYFKGAFDNIKVYNRVLSEAEIAGGEFVDKEPLKDLLDEYAGIDPDFYTEESAAAFKQAYADAAAVYYDDNATAEEVAAAADALQKAGEGLERPVPVELPYKDVVDSDWFYDGVYYTYVEGLMTGKDAETFAPLENLARGQFAVILHRVEEEPDMAYEAIFPDVPEGWFYTEAILWAYENKIVTGYTATGTFGPSDNITREQMAVMMYRYAKDYKGYDVSNTADFSNFTDAKKVSEFAEEAMEWAVGMGIITGKDNEDGSKYIDPQGNTLRAECALIIQRFMEAYAE